MKAIIGKIMLVMGLVFGLTALVGSPASADPAYSTDSQNPTLVTEVPEGFEALGDPDVVVDDCITTTTQVFSRSNQGSAETFTYGYEQRTREPIDAVNEYRSATKEYTPGTDADYTHQWQKQVREEKFKTKYQYQKQVKGEIERRHWGDWDDVGNFDWEFWTSANGWDTSGSFQWSFSDVSVLDEGYHNDTSDQWNDWHTDHNGTHMDQFRKHSERYRYVKNGVVDSIPDGYTAWVNSGSPVLSDTKPGVDTDTVKWIDNGGNFVEAPATFGTWGSWVPALDFTDGWTGDETVTPPAVLGSATLPSITWNQSRVQPGTGPGYFTEWSAWELVEDGLADEPSLPDNTDTHEYRPIEPVGNDDAVEPFTEYVKTVTKTGQSCPTTTTQPPATPPTTVTPSKECVDTNGKVFTIDPEQDCPVVKVEVDEPKVEVLDEQVTAETLAFTGGESKALAAAGFALVIAGVALTVLRRRNERNENHLTND